MPAVADTTFLVIGAGGLGAPVLLALAAAGAGRLVIVDDDVVELSNLQRQVLYRTEDVGRPKADTARRALLRRFPQARIEAVRARFDEATARALLHDADVVCDGSDNLTTKFLVNDACVAAGKPFVIAGVLRHEGQVFPVRPTAVVEDPCYRCLFEAPPADDGMTCADAGVLGATCGEVGGLQARAALALATGLDPAGILGRFWLVSGLDQRQSAPRAISIRPRTGCTACASKEAA